MIFLIYTSYSEPHRHYHTLAHPARMFQIARECSLALSWSEVLAIWFHDIIYNIPRDSNVSNEELSANMAEVHLEADEYPTEIINLTCNMIRDTEEELPEREERSDTIIDLDLWDLSSYHYWINRALIRKEYGHLSDEEWREGRIEWLKKMLARKTIYVSSHSSLDMEQQAQYNMKSELNHLQTGDHHVQSINSAEGTNI